MLHHGGDNQRVASALFDPPWTTAHIQAKSEGYKRSRNTRVFAVAVSADESGEDALDWLMSELVEDGDEIVAIRVIELGEGGESCCI